MSGFIEGEDRYQATLFPERLVDYIAENSAIRVIDIFIDDLDLSGLGFKMEANETGRPPSHPATLLKLYVYGYLNRVQSSRRLEREAQCNVELMLSIPGTTDCLCRLMNIGITGFVFVLRRRGYIDDRRIHNRATAYLQSILGQIHVVQPEHLITQIMAFHLMPEVEYRGLVRYGLFAQVNPDTLPHYR